MFANSSEVLRVGLLVWLTSVEMVLDTKVVSKS